MRWLALAALALLLGQGLVPTTGAHHAAPDPNPAIQRLDRQAEVSWRAVAFAPDGSHALLVGNHETEDLTRSLVARWTPEGGLEEVYNRSGAGFSDVAFAPDGRSLVVGLRNEILLGEPGAYRNIWNESRYAQQSDDLVFYGLGADFRPGTGEALITGSSLLRMHPNGSLDTVHGGRNAFFRSVDFNPDPKAEYGLVEAGVDQQDGAVLGTIWRTDGRSSLGEGDNLAIYGRFARRSAMLNSISFAPNATFALLSGIDGPGATFLTWSATRAANHTHPGGDQPHDHRWKYQATDKKRGSVSCIAWHPSQEWALTTGSKRDVIGIAGTRVWVPLLHKGPDLEGCAMHPTGDYALAVGANGTLLRIESRPGPLVGVAHPQPGSLVAPRSDQTFLLDVIDRGGAGNVSVTARVDEDGAREHAFREGRWWRVNVNTSDLSDGEHDLVVEVTTEAGRTLVRHPFLVNNDDFTPQRPEMRAPRGLEGQGSDSDGVFTLRWEPSEKPVVYEVQQQRTGERVNATKVLQAGSASNLTVRVGEDGSYVFRVRALNAYNESRWSPGVAVNVVLDSDQDGVPDARDPRPHVHDTWGDQDGDGISDDVELNQCSDPRDASSTPGTDDDGDGISNGKECLRGTDPLDPNDPPPEEPPENETNDTGDPDDGSSIPAPGVLALLLAALAAAGLRRRS